MYITHLFLEENNGSSNVAKGSMLKFIYGDLTPSRINDLKEACRREVCLFCKQLEVHVHVTCSMYCRLANKSDNFIRCHIHITVYRFYQLLLTCTCTM